MKIAFAIQKQEGWDSIINSRFGRTENFALYDEKSDSFSYKSNEENVDAGHGAGIQASQIVVNFGAEVVITGGSYGPKAFDVLKAAKIKTFSQVGEITLKEAYKNFKANKYSETLESDK
ncbi:MAG TPA: dinitrogenase iron-molybdenum cofactor biosynthesis protein [Bacteroidales bacterium]|nr:MAG: hypothetical protein A2W98_15180 [Bacteroidetes bacterium GWF2_33_38]OFY74798.1 MAG: hypothetical protein A2265_07540 [Bacteroidetes bacterium RIFOXYA12_FULL_33_9]OFY89913.1 MAG: hypothetical protein A2236_09940 [Bacteroidetes bacterium RIFOXYA2_FULL_33_7]HBF88820.1 dinitrogenase iron-molybdenum cofactor biosynthesis protein [Bacteroidales bacterium]